MSQFVKVKMCAAYIKHISEKDNFILAERWRRKEFDLFVVLPSIYGWCVVLEHLLLDAEYVNDLIREGYSPAFIELLKDARKEGFHWLMLDDDVLPQKGREIFKW